METVLAYWFEGGSSLISWQVGIAWVLLSACLALNLEAP